MPKDQVKDLLGRSSLGAAPAQTARTPFLASFIHAHLLFLSCSHI